MVFFFLILFSPCKRTPSYFLVSLIAYGLWMSQDMALAVREPESEEKPQKYLNEKQQVTYTWTSCANCNSGTTFLAVLHSAFLFNICYDLCVMQENQDLLVKCISQNLGYAGGKPVAACVIYKSLLHWRSFEVERTNVFDRIIQTIASAIEVSLFVLALLSRSTNKLF